MRYRHDETGAARLYWPTGIGNNYCRVLAIEPLESDGEHGVVDGVAAANRYLEANPEAALLAIHDGHAIIARYDDLGVTREAIAAGWRNRGGAA